MVLLLMMIIWNNIYMYMYIHIYIEHTEREYIGVRDLRLVHTLLQVIISWGMYPYFLPGVGVPLSKRVKSGYTNHGNGSTKEIFLIFIGKKEIND